MIIKKINKNNKLIKIKNQLQWIQNKIMNSLLKLIIQNLLIKSNKKLIKIKKIKAI